MTTILSSGSIAMDVVLNSSDLPINDGFALINKEEILPGGSSANVCVSAAGFGMDTYQVGKIGTDEIGDLFKSSLVEDGVNDKYIYTKEGGITTHTYIVTTPDGRHTIFANMGDCLPGFEPSELPDNILDGIDIYFTDMFSPKVSLFLAKEAHKRNCKIVMNMQAVPSFMPLCGASKEMIHEVLSLSSMIVGGKDAILEIVGSCEFDPIDAVKTVYEMYKPDDGVICTLGSEGAIWFGGQSFIKVDSYDINVVDTTGAGDCFIGGLLYSLYDKGNSISDSLKFASASAAIKCMKYGPRSIASYDEVMAIEGSLNRSL